MRHPPALFCSADSLGKHLLTTTKYYYYLLPLTTTANSLCGAAVQDASFGLKASLMHELPACRLSCSDLMGTYGSRVIRTPYAGARGSIASGCLRGGLAALVCGAAFQVAHAASRLTSCRSARQYFLVLFLWSLGCSDYWDGFCSRKADLSSARLRCTALELGAEGEGRQSP